MIYPTVYTHIEWYHHGLILCQILWQIDTHGFIHNAHVAFCLLVPIDVIFIFQYCFTYNKYHTIIDGNLQQNLGDSP